MNVTGYYLENTTGTHNKFYLICISDDGLVTTTWGRIGAVGQNKVQRFHSRIDAETIGMRQFFAKRSGGYEVVHEAIKFQVPDSYVVADTNAASTLGNAFWRAVRDPQFEGDKNAVLTHYTELLTKAQRLMDQASTMNFADAQGQFEELEKVWEEIEDKHAEVAITMEFTKQMIGAALVSGKL